MSPLDRKLLRDLWRMKGQAVAIAAVIASGVMLLVMMTGNVTSLEETRRAYYERYRFADVFAPVVRAPDRLVQRLETIPGVDAAEGRVTGGALIDLPGLDVPVTARAVSLPDVGEPRLNAVYLTGGRLFERSRPDEIVLLEGFATAHGLVPGDRLKATMNGARRTFDIVGVARSPEFLYTTAPGEFVPDDRRFGVIWMSRSALAAAYDMEGAFNEALIRLGRGAALGDVIAAVDRVLDPQGGLGAYGVEDQVSNRFLSEEIMGLRLSSRSVPPLFLLVAAFLLYIVISRTVEAEREEIGLIKAFGYTDAEVSLHYFKFVLIIASGGALAGCVGGIILGRGLTDLYLEYYKFPFLVFRVDPAALVIGAGVSLLSASAGGLFVLRRVFALAPAEAMRPPSPPDFSGTIRFGRRLSRMLDQPSRMVLRRVLHQPGRMAGAVAGIACGMALSAGNLSIFEGFTRTMEQTYSIVDRSDVMVSFNHAMSEDVIHDLRRRDGVFRVEPVRYVPAVLRKGTNSYRGAVTALTAEPVLFRAVDKESRTIELPPEGIVLSTGLAGELGAAAGDLVRLEVLEGRRPVIETRVAKVSESLFGAPGYMNLDAMNRLLKEGGRISGAYLTIDTAQEGEIYRELKDMPALAGVSVKHEARAALQKLLDSGAGSVRYISLFFAGVITFGIVYNAARIAEAERARDLAGLRVMGFTRSETAFVLLGEIAVVTLLALPIGAVLGYAVAVAIAAAYSTDLYQVPVIFSPGVIGAAAVAVIGAAVVSGIAVKRSVDRADIIETLKSRD